MNLVIILIIALSLTACASTEEQRKPTPSFSVKIDVGDVEYEIARTIALQYLSHVAWYDYDGKKISVEKCGGTESEKCDYIVHHRGNGCGWGSSVIVQCDSGVCTYKFTPYDAGAVLCE